MLREPPLQLMLPACRSSTGWPQQQGSLKWPPLRLMLLCRQHHRSSAFTGMLHDPLESFRHSHSFLKIWSLQRSVAHCELWPHMQIAHHGS